MAGCCALGLGGSAAAPALPPLSSGRKFELAASERVLVVRLLTLASSAKSARALPFAFKVNPSPLLTLPYLTVAFKTGPA